MKSLGRLLTRLVLLDGQQVWTDFVYLTCVEGLKEQVFFGVTRRFLLDSDCQSSMLMAAATVRLNLCLGLAEIGSPVDTLQVFMLTLLSVLGWSAISLKSTFILKRFC